MQATTPDISKTQTLLVNRRALIMDVDGPDTPLFCVRRNELGFALATLLLRTRWKLMT
jgi:hypothetical protein